MSDPNTPGTPTPDGADPALSGSGAGAPPPHPYARQGRSGAPAWVIWLIGGLAALAFTAIMVVFVLNNLRNAEQPAEPAPPSATADAGADGGAASEASENGGSDDAGDGAGSQPSDPDAEAQLVWPRNMLTGGLLFGEGMQLQQSDAPTSVEGFAPREADRSDDVADILLYVDYSCPHCVAFETLNGELLEQIVSEGEATLQVTPLNFMDRVDPASYYSSRASGAMACLAENQPEAAWSAHTALLTEDQLLLAHSGEATNAAIVDLLDEAVGGLGDEARSCIEQERFAAFATALNDWVFSGPVPHAEDPELRVEGTPLVVVNGVSYTGSPEDAQQFRGFLEQQGVQVG